MAACIVSCWDVCNESNHPCKGLVLQLFTRVVVGRMVEIGKVDWLSESAVDIGSLFFVECIPLLRNDQSGTGRKVCGSVVRGKKLKKKKN